MGISNYSKDRKGSSAMCTYCGTNKYRKIYENHIGPIPNDSTGRTYDVHHVDGNRNNNIIDNLIALSIQDHYDLHYSQGDYAACVRIAQKMKLSITLIKELVSRQQRLRVELGIHHFLGGEIARKANAERVANGTHQFLGGDQSRKNNTKMLANGTHPWVGKSCNESRLANGTHPSQMTSICPHCNTKCSVANYAKWHGDNCVKVKARKPIPRKPCPHCGTLATANILGRDHKNGKCLKI